MIVRELMTVLGFKANDKALVAYEKSVKNLKKSLKFLTGQATAAAAAIFGLAETTARAVDAEVDAATAIGISTQSYQELLYGVKRYGGSLGDLQAMLARVSDQTTKAIEGNEGFREAYRQLGISVEDMKRLAPDELLKRVADGIRNTEDPAKRLSLATELFSRRARDLMPFLLEGKDGIEALGQASRETGYTMSEDAVHDVGDYIATMHDFRMSLEGLRRTLASEAIPRVREWVDKLMEWYRANRELVKSKLSSVLRGLVRVLELVALVGGPIVLMLDKLVELFGGYENAIKLATVALAFYALVQAAVAVTSITSTITSIASAFNLLKVSAAKGWAAVGGPVALVVAGILLLILILEDLYAWSEGRESFFGDMFPDLAFEQIREKIKWIMIGLGALVGLVAFFAGGWIIAVVAAISVAVATFAMFYDDMVDWTANAIAVTVEFFAEWYQKIVAWVTSLGEELGETLAEWFFPLIDGFETAKAKILAMFKAMVDTIIGWAKKIGDVFGNVIGGAKKLIDKVNPFADDEDAPSGEQLAGAYVGGGAAGPSIDARRRINQVENSRSNQTNVGEVSVNVQGSTNMGPDELARATEEGIQRALERQAKNASEAFGGGEAY